MDYLSHNNHTIEKCSETLKIDPRYDINLNRTELKIQCFIVNMIGLHFLAYY